MFKHSIVEILMIKILGLDIGISSIGWSLVEVDPQVKDTGDILGCGVRFC